METNSSASEYSKEPYASPSTIKSGERQNFKQETLNIDEIICSLNDEYKKGKFKPMFAKSWMLGKSSIRSRTIRDNHKVVVDNKDSYLEALRWNTERISLARSYNEELASAYEKRAFALFKLSLYDQSVADLRRAIPCAQHLDTRENLTESLRMYSQHIMSAIPRPERLPVRLRPTNDNPERIAGIIEEERAATTASTDAADDRDREWRDMCRLDNRCIQNASSKIRLRYDEKKWGRFVEATEDLEAGEIIAVQEVFTGYLRCGLEFVRCSLCFTLCAALIPCPFCRQMMYCSEYCRDSAYDLYHRMECKIMRMLFEPDDLNKTEFRVVRQLLIGTDQGCRLGELMETITVQDIMATEFPPSEIFEDEYVTALRLHKSYARDRVKKFVPFVAKMIKTLQRVGFFEESDRSLPYDPEDDEDDTTSDGTMTKAQVFTSFLLLNHIAGMDKYFFDVKIIREKRAPTDDDGTIASGFCTLFPVFNHSCDANVFIMPRGWQAAFITGRPIAKGEEITVSYALVGEDCDFVCQCDACMNRWYTLKNLQARPEFFSHINPVIARSELKTLLRPVADLKKSKSLPPNEILRIVLDACKWLYTNIKHPTLYHFEIQRLVSLFMRLFYGTLNEHIPLEAVIEEAYYSVWLKIMDDLGIDLESCSV